MALAAGFIPTCRECAVKKAVPSPTIKRLVESSLLLIAGGLAGYATALLIAAHHARTSNTPKPDGEAVLISVSATIDGSERFIFTRENIWNDHGKWQPPRDVLFNGEPWTDLTAAPAAWANLGRELDLSRASLVVRKGRDIVALERTSDGFELYFADTPMGAARYEATISIPHR
ncbi:MAG: hypothetical protein QOF48_4010 [Verrucomicrobiota bacterium]